MEGCSWVVDGWRCQHHEKGGLDAVNLVLVVMAEAARERNKRAPVFALCFHQIEYKSTNHHVYNKDPTLCSGCNSLPTVALLRRLAKA